jgi:hypothetical protein
MAGWQRAAKELADYAKACGASDAYMVSGEYPPKLAVVYGGRTTVIRLLASGEPRDFERKLRGIIKKACRE